MAHRIPAFSSNVAPVQSAFTGSPTSTSEMAKIRLPLSSISLPPSSHASTAEKADMTGKRLIQLQNMAEPPLKKSATLKPRSRPDKLAIDRLFDAHAYTEALDVCEKTLARNPHDQNAFFKKAVCLWHLGQVQESIECLTHYLMKYPNDAQAWARKGAILIYQHQYPQALKDLRKSEVLDPSDLVLEFYIFGFSCESFRQVATSAPYYLRHPDPSLSAEDVHLLHAFFFASHKEYESAMQEIQKARKSPNDLAGRILKVLKRDSKRLKQETQEKNKTLLSTGYLPISSLVHPHDLDPQEASPFSPLSV
ncbi:MAG: tetratricopeptide repeat protein [Verrucomicrobia bacterium]|nr:tetratricopeptide repeat protein [Verrucomicrobiota bacterium]